MVRLFRYLNKRYIYARMRFLLLSIILFCAVTSKGSNLDLLKCDGYTIEDGLPQSFIQKIYQDSKGYLWVATQDGIAKFNGHEFKSFFFDPFDKNSLISNYALDIDGWSQDTLFIATSVGISLMNTANNTFKNYPLSQTFPFLGSVTSAEILGGGDILIGASRGLYRVHLSDSLTSDDIHAYDNELRVTDLFTLNGETYVASRNSMYQVKGKRLQLVKESSSQIVHLFQFSENAIGVASKDSLLFFELSNDFQPPIIHFPMEITVAAKINGAVWFGTKEHGVFIYQPKNTAAPFQWLRKEGNGRNGLFSNNIKSILQDKFGVVWIGSDKGLNKIDPDKQQFLNVRPKEDFPQATNNCWSFYEDDTLFIAGFSNGLQIEEKHFGQTLWIEYDQYILDIKAIGNRIVLATSEGLATVGYKDTSYVVEALNIPLTFDSLSQPTVFKIHVLDSLVLLGSIRGLSILNKDLKLKEFFKLSNVRDFVQTDQGELFTIAYPSGVYEIKDALSPNPSIAFRKIDGLDQLLSLCIETVGDDLWIGLYGGGVLRFNRKTGIVKHFSTKNDLPNNSVYGLVADNNGHLWMSTNGGLTRFNLQDEKFVNYKSSDGLQSLEFNSGAYFKSKDGKIYFGGIEGYNIVNTELQEANAIPPRIYLSKVMYQGKNILPEAEEWKEGIDQVVIPYHRNSFTIEVDAIHFSSPEENGYAYRMVGFQDDWEVVKNKRTFYYSNLSAGRYLFEVKAANSDGVWSETIRKIYVRIKPPFYMTWWFLSIASLVLAIGVFAIYYSRVSIIKRQKAILERKVKERTQEVEKQKTILVRQKNLLEEEKNKEEKVLLNILPRETAKELISTGKATPKSYEMATVMFADFKNFTKITENLTPKELVAELDDYFASFDDIVDEFHIEKIKTSGDAYMCVGGIPIKNRTNPIDCVLGAFKFQKYMDEKRQIREGTGKDNWHLRVGLHTGELVAGVVGKKKFLYDVWGDTVNVASRMETSSEPGRVNISGNTYSYIKDYFDCEYRGKLPVKNKGAIDMYYVNRIKPELSEDEEGYIPNRRFYELLNFNVYSKVNYNKVKGYVMNKLQEELPSNLYYHGPHHTKDVMRAAERIGKAEGLSEEELLLVKLAALFHDSGFLNKYRENEPEGAKFARELLPKYGFTDHQVDLVEGMILATKVPQRPTNHLEQVICDADLDYLGREKDEFEQISSSLEKELIEYGFLASSADWDPIQIKFLEAHSYYTKTCIAERQPNKMLRLEEIKARVALKRGE